MSAVLEWIAQPKQSKFLVDFAGVDFAFYGGAAGGGKTDALIAYQILRRQRFPGSKGLFLRRSFADLSKSGSAIDRFLELTKALGVRYDGNAHKGYWPNGSVTEFGYCASNADKTNYQGAQYDDICIDEATQLEPDWITYIAARARVRSKELRDMGLKRQVRAAGNPGGMAHAWFREHFIVFGDGVIHDWKSGDPKVPDQTRVFVSARVDDNQELMESDPSYKAGLMQISNETERRAMLDGDWDVFEGQVFTEWRKDFHAIPVMTPPGSWPHWIGFDWGYAAPCSVGWYAQFPDTGQIVRYNEMYQNKLTDTEMAQRILSMSHGQRIDYMVCDPSIWSHKGGNATTAEVFERVFGGRIPLVPANNDRMTGLRRCHDFLAWRMDEQNEIFESPLFMVTENCTNFIRTIPLLQHDKNRVEDVDSGMEDHCYDEWRYSLASRNVVRYADNVFGGSVVLLNRG